MRFTRLDTDFTGWTRTGTRFTRLDTDWYEIHKALAQPANHTVYWVCCIQTGPHRRHALGRCDRLLHVAYVVCVSVLITQ